MNDEQEKQISPSTISHSLFCTAIGVRLSFSPEQPIFSYMEKPNSQPASSPARSAVIDLQVLDDIRALQGEDSPAFLDQIIHTYLEHTPQLFAALHEAVVRNNALTLQRTAHSLKSSSAALGATTLAALCQDLELLGRQQNLEKVTAVLATATAEYELVREALAAELQREP